MTAKQRNNFFNKIKKFDTPDSCWLWTAGTNPRGYGTFSMGDKMKYAHRVSYEIHKGPIGEYHCLHRCGNPSCVNPEHLYLGTQADNSAECASKGMMDHKLTVDDVREIRTLLNTTEMFQKDIAAKFGVHQANVSAIALGKTWKHVN